MKEGKIIFKTIVGSQAYGTNVEGSDIDIKGVYIQDMMDIATYNYQPQIEVSKDEVYYEIRRFIELLATANPTVLEMLFSPEECVQIQEEEFDILMQYRNEFLTKKCQYSFGGYAIQQIKKAKGLNKKMNWEKDAVIRKSVKDFAFVFDPDLGTTSLADYLESHGFDQAYCGLTNIDHFKDCYALHIDWDAQFEDSQPLGLKGICDDNSNALRLSSIPKHLSPIATVYYNKDSYTQHCNAFKEYATWLKERNTQRYVDIATHGQQIDGKNMLHCRRLIDTAYEIATLKTLNVKRPNADYLKSIRKGEVDLETLLTSAQQSIESLDTAYTITDLPKDFSLQRAQEILVEIRKSFSKSLVAVFYTNIKLHGGAQEIS